MQVTKKQLPEPTTFERMTDEQLKEFDKRVENIVDRRKAVQNIDDALVAKHNSKRKSLTKT
jgi:hypothetical protein